MQFESRPQIQGLTNAYCTTELHPQHNTGLNESKSYPETKKEYFFSKMNNKDLQVASI